MGRKDRSRSPRSRSRDRKKDKQHKRSNSRQRRKQKHRSRSKQRRQEKHKSKFSEGSFAEDKVTSKVTQLSSKLTQNLYGQKDSIKNLSLVQKLNPANKNLGIGLTLVEGSSNFPLGLNNSVFSMMADASKIKRKIVLPKDSNFNYSGLLIGPKGNNQKQLEQRTGCRILVRGKGSQNQTNDHEDQQDLHVLVLGDNEGQVAKACAEIQRIIFADDDTLNKLKQEQMVQYQQGIAGQADDTYNLSLTTPYGPPSDNAYILEVPNQCVGLVIGKQGQTIKNIAKKSGALKVQVATSSAPGSKSRNIFVEGDYDSVERVRKELNAIVQTQRKMNMGTVSGSHIIQVQVPVRLIGLVIGKGGETIKGINARTGAFVCLNKDQTSRKNRKVLTITGTQDLCMIAKYQIDKIIQKGLINLQNTGGLRPEEAEMVKPLTPIAMQLAQANIPIPTQVQTIIDDPTTMYVLSKTLQNQIPTEQLFTQFLGPTKSVIEEVVIDQGKEKKRKFVKKM